MKKLFLISVLLCMEYAGTAQFIAQPLNYPGVGYWPLFISITDANHVWIGTVREFALPCSSAVKTSNGGNSWTFNSIPVGGEPLCTSICSWDTNTCFYVFTDLVEYGGAVWKTTDGGTSWSNMTTTQFVDGFANFYHAFSADTGLAMGDPTGGYFEIQLTNDGGASWSRVPSANIPVPLTGECGLANLYSAVGNSIWFSTNKGRCFRSVDRGLHWNVTQVIAGNNNNFNVCFSTEQNGAFWKSDGIISNISLTNDGGISWYSVPFSGGYTVFGMSRVPGFEGGFILTGYKNYMDVFFTPNMFNYIVKIDSSIMSIGSISFLNATTGWLGGGESGTNEIFKYTGVLTSVAAANKTNEKLSIIPNPSSTESLIKLPSYLNFKTIDIRINDLTGRTIQQYSLISNGWTTLNASAFQNGLYIVEVFLNHKLQASERWIVSHK